MGLDQCNGRETLKTMEIEEKVERVSAKIDLLKDFCTAEFKSIAVDLAKLEVATADRNKIWGKGTIKLFAAVIIAVLTSLGVYSACANSYDEDFNIGVSMDTGDGGE